MAKTLVSQIFNAEASLGNPSTNGYILSSTTAGVRSWIASTGGVTPTSSGLLFWNSSSSRYEPWSSQSAGRFDSSSVAPVGTTRLNYNGIFYVPQLVVSTGGSAVGITSTSTTGQGIIGVSTSNYGVVGHSTNGTGIIGSSDNSVGILAQSNTSNALWVVNSTGNTSNIIRASVGNTDKLLVDINGNVNIALGATYKINSVDVIHSPVTISVGNGLSISGQAISLTTANTNDTGALTNTDWNTFNDKVSFPGFGTSHSTSAYGDHNHTGVYEPVLGNPSTNGYILSSTTEGTRSWIAAPSAVTVADGFLKWNSSTGTYERYTNISSLGTSAGIASVLNVARPYSSSVDSNSLVNNGPVIGIGHSVAASLFVSDNSFGVDGRSVTQPGVNSASYDGVGFIAQTITSGNTNDIVQFYINGGSNLRARFSYDGDMELPVASKGVILNSPNGTRYRLTVNNSGSIIVTAI